MKRSDRLAEDAEAVRAFADAYRAYLDLGRSVKGSPGDLSYDQPVAEMKRRRPDLNALAGPAADALDRAGLGLAIRGVGEINPVRTWATAGGNRMSEQAVLDTAEQAVSTIRARADLARRGEKTAAGRLARFFRFPYDVREHAGLPSAGGQRVAFGFAVAVQTVVTGALAGAAGTALWEFFQWVAD